jgi:hypothetical protein
MRGLKARNGFRLVGSLAALMVVAALGCAEDKGVGSHPESDQPGETHQERGANPKLRRLESVTWNPVSDELTWVVSTGDKAAGPYQPAVKETYHIQMDSATMTVSGEGRHFSQEEAENVQVLMDLLSKYAIDSTIWWEAGQGDKLDGEGNPLPGNKNGDKKPAPNMRRADGQVDMKALRATLASLERRAMESPSSR